MSASQKKENTSKKPTLLSLLKNYKLLVASVVFLSLCINLLGLTLPKISARAIDSLQNQTYNRNEFLTLFIGIATVILILGFIQNIISNITSEKIAKELRRQVIEKISRQSFKYINTVSTSKLLTNLTSDADAVKQFINQGLVIAFASVVQLLGSAIILLVINWKLAIPVLLTIPVLMVAFGIIFSSIEKYFIKAQEVIDKLNRVINESIVGAPLIRVLNSNQFETKKFIVVNAEAKQVGTRIITQFAILIPVITLVVNAAYLVIVGYGGVQVIDKTLSAGDFTAFFSYIFIFISPIITIGFIASTISRAFATYGRLREVIDAEEPKALGEVIKDIQGDIKLEHVTLEIDSKAILEDITFEIKPKNRVGIIGPTAAGKTQIFYLITGLIDATSGKILVDGTEISEYNPESLYSQIGMVFQDSIIFNTSIRENIAFRSEISDEALWKAIETAELKDFVDSLPHKLDQLISERGLSLSGGQKQRLTLARALAINPKILLLDDFTARVDIKTEKKIFENLKKNYPDITIIAITQKISSVEDFDKVILVMEGELVAQGTHKELLESSLEYRQIFNSQKQAD